ncbi:radical SAM protein [Pelomyxa schiedti]|nr:radical SAM protein [Pelomyxa schiedti]
MTSNGCPPLTSAFPRPRNSHDEREFTVELDFQAPGVAPTKFVHSGHYHSMSNLETGEVHRWGESVQEEPALYPAPEYVEIEISACHSHDRRPSSGSSKMSFETFLSIFHTLPKSVSQIMFRSGDIDSNSDLPHMLAYCRNNSYNYVVPNVTLSGIQLTPALADTIKSDCGAVSLSRLANNKDNCYDSIQSLSTGTGARQLYINIIFAHETIPLILETIADIALDSRIQGKIVALLLVLWKPGSPPSFYSSPNREDYESIIEWATMKEVRVGYDTDAGRNIFTTVNDIPQLINNADIEDMSLQLEGCKSMSRNIFINVKGEVMPCPFLEQFTPWNAAKYNILTCSNFFQDIWYSSDAVQFRGEIASSSHVPARQRCKYASS